MSATRSWTVSDELWAKGESVIPKRRRQKGRRYLGRPGAGRKSMEPRQVFAAILFLFRTGCRWKALPQAAFGSPSAIHKYFLQWKRQKVFVKLWRKGLAEYDELEVSPGNGGASMGPWSKRPSPSRPLGRTRRTGQKGTKRSLLVDGNGIPLSLSVSGALWPDMVLFVPTFDRVVIPRPAPEAGREHLCGDKGYAGQPADLAVRARQYVPPIPQRGADPGAQRRHPQGRARRWVLERIQSWLNRF